MNVVTAKSFFPSLLSIRSWTPSRMLFLLVSMAVHKLLTLFLFIEFDTPNMQQIYFNVLASSRYPNLTTFSLSHCIYGLSPLPL